ncbi:MAG: hypothetical protein R8M38_02500 [Mariprofundaceae bacterium]
MTSVDLTLQGLDMSRSSVQDILHYALTARPESASGVVMGIEGVIRFATLQLSTDLLEGNVVDIGGIFQVCDRESSTQNPFKHAENVQSLLWRAQSLFVDFPKDKLVCLLVDLATNGRMEIHAFSGSSGEEITLKLVD